MREAIRGERNNDINKLVDVLVYKLLFMHKYKCQTLDVKFTTMCGRIKQWHARHRSTLRNYCRLLEYDYDRLDTFHHYVTAEGSNHNRRTGAHSEE